MIDIILFAYLFITKHFAIYLINPNVFNDVVFADICKWGVFVFRGLQPTTFGLCNVVLLLGFSGFSWELEDL